MDNDEQYIFYTTFLWLLLISIIIVVVTLVIFNVIKQYALFQATRDQKWYPEKENCDTLEMESGPLVGCRDYTEDFTDSYLIIGDRRHKDFNKQQITKVSQSRMFNIGDLHYINIWKFEHFKGNRVVLYFHGNNDNISYRKYVIDICHFLKLNLVLIDYRGYGDSSALPNSKFLLEDAKTVYLHVAQHYNPEEIIIWGESLGGIPAIWTAHKYKCHALILLSTFADLRTIVDKMDAPDMIKKMLNKIAHNKYMNNSKWIRDVDVPTVIIHSPDDDILPYINAELNYNSVNTDKKKLINISGPHAHPYFTYENLEDLLKFINIEDDVLSNHKTMGKILDIINSL